METMEGSGVHDFKYEAFCHSEGKYLKRGSQTILQIILANGKVVKYFSSAFFVIVGSQN